MASLRTLLRLHGGGLRPQSTLWMPVRCCAASTKEVEVETPKLSLAHSFEHDKELIQDRLSRPLRKHVTREGKSRVMRALASTWRPLKRPLMYGFRTHNDELAYDTSVEKESELLAEEAAVFMAKFHDLKFGEAFPWTDPASPPKDLGERLLWYVERLNTDKATATRAELRAAGKMTQHLENCWLDARLAWIILEAEQQIQSESTDGTKRDPVLINQMQLVNDIRDVWKEVQVKDPVTHSLYVSALAHIGASGMAVQAVEEAHEESVQVSLGAFHHMLDSLPKAWSTPTYSQGNATGTFSDEGRVKDTMTVLELMVAGPRHVQPNALTFEKACALFQTCGSVGSSKIFSVLEEMDYCKIEPSLGTYFYIFNASMTHLGKPDILSDIVRRLGKSKAGLKVNSPEDAQFMNRALQQLALDGSSVTPEVVADAAKIVAVAEKANFSCVADHAALINDYARLVAFLPSVTITSALKLVEMVEHAVASGAFLNFYTFSVLGAIGDHMEDDFIESLYIRSFNALKLQLIKQQYKILFPAMLLKPTQVGAGPGRAGDTIMSVQAAVVPMMENLLEDFDLYAVLPGAVRPMPFRPVVEELQTFSDAHQELSLALVAFKKTMQYVLPLICSAKHHSKGKPDVSAVLQTFKEVCVLHLCVGVKMSGTEVRCLGQLAVSASEVSKAVTAMTAQLEARSLPQLEPLSELLAHAIRGSSSDDLLGALALVATCGVRLTIDRYSEIAASFSRPTLLTALWLGEQTVDLQVVGGESKDLLRIWSHVYTVIEARRDGLDDFLLDDSDLLNKDNSRSLKKLFEELSIQKKLSPLDLVEKETPEGSVVDVFDANEDEDEELNPLRTQAGQTTITTTAEQAAGGDHQKDVSEAVLDEPGAFRNRLFRHWRRGRKK